MSTGLLLLGRRPGTPLRGVSVLALGKGEVLRPARMVGKCRARATGALADGAWSVAARPFGQQFAFQRWISGCGELAVSFHTGAFVRRRPGVFRRGAVRP